MNKMRQLTLKEILNFLDGRGLVITDEQLLEESLRELGLSESAIAVEGIK